MKTPKDAGTKVCSNGPGRMAKMAAMPIYSKKPFKNLRLQNQKADNLRNWHVALGVLVLPSLSNDVVCDDPRLTLTYLTSRSNLLPNAFKWDFF